MKKFIKYTMCGLTAATLALAPFNVYAASQDESVYVKLQPTGEVKYTSVTKHLINNEKAETILDRTNLRDVENINGFETYDLQADSLVWHAQGKDIYYSGTTEQNLPITIEVSYRLNGESKNLSEILGQSGQVEITFRYHNLSKVNDLYTPFVIAFATTLPETSVHNVNISNGKIISNGRSLAVTAIAAPGLYDSLKLDELKDLDQITLTYETDNFELPDIYNVVTPKLLESDDLKIFNEVDKISADAQKLSDSSKQLVNGMSSLRDGIATMRSAILAAEQQLQTTGNLLDESTLSQISNTAATSAREQVAAQKSVIRAQINQQFSNLQELQQLESLKSELQNLAPLMIQPKVEQTIATEIQKGIAEACQSGGYDCSVEAVKTQVEATVAAEVELQRPFIEQQVTNAVQQKLNINIDPDNIKETLFQSTYSAMRNVASETASKTARSVATQVSGAIQEGVSTQLNTLMSKMVVGFDDLLAGADELNNGIQQFDRDGIQKLNNVVNGQLKTTSNKAKRLIELADQYNSFSGISEDMKGDTKFILMIEGQKKQ